MSEFDEAVTPRIWDGLGALGKRRDEEERFPVEAVGALRMRGSSTWTQ